MRRAPSILALPILALPILALPILAPSILALMAPPAWAQGKAPRVDARDAAEGAQVVVSEVDDAAHPEMRIFATVMIDGIPVTGLGVEDFRVCEDEVDQRPLTVEPQLPPLSVVLAIDTPGSMADAMGAARRAAASFVDGLGERDAVQVLRFAREIDTPTSMTTTKDEARAAIEALAARGDTALCDAVARSVELVAERPGRKAIVVLSDGVDDGAGRPLSEATVARVLEAAGRVGVPIFTVGLGTEMDEAVLSEVAETTRGLHLDAPTAEELGSVCERIGEQLPGQYAIGYTSSLPADGTERRIDREGPGGRDSRTHAPEGTVAAAAPAPPPSAEGCPPLEAMEAAQEGLDRNQGRHEEGLVDILARNRSRDEAVAGIEAVAITQEVGYDCMVRAMERLQDFHGGDPIDILQRDRPRDHLARPLGETCAGEGTMDGVVRCLEVVGRAHEDGLIDILQRNRLRERAVEPPTREAMEMEDADAALRRVGELDEAGLIDAPTRNELRDAILARE